jgi:hypothetical protein
MALVTGNRPPGFNIDEFKSRVTDAGGVIKNNKFRLVITPPYILTAQTQKSEALKTILDGNRYIEFFCYAASIPGVALNTHEVRRYGYGPAEKRPYNASFRDITLSLYFDNRRRNYDFLQLWIESIFNTDPRAGIDNIFITDYKENYASTLELYVYDDGGVLTAKYVMTEAFPIQIGDMPVSWADTNNLLKIPVTFTFYTFYNDFQFNPGLYDTLDYNISARGDMITGGSSRTFYNESNEQGISGQTQNGGNVSGESSSGPILDPGFRGKVDPNYPGKVYRLDKNEFYAISANNISKQ